jgi:hypothetical protein
MITLSCYYDNISYFFLKTLHTGSIATLEQFAPWKILLLREIQGWIARKWTPFLKDPALHIFSFPTVYKLTVEL